MDWTSIIIALITACVPASVTVYTNKKSTRRAEMHAARQSILQLILEDKVAVMSGSVPENYQAVLSEFDDYEKNGGNHYVKGKVEEYTKWYKEVNENHTRDVQQ